MTCIIPCEMIHVIFVLKIDVFYLDQDFLVKHGEIVSQENGYK